MRSRYVPLSLCLPRFLLRRLFLLPKRHLRNLFRCRPTALSVSLSRYRPTNFFFPHQRERVPPPKFRNIITLSPKRFSFSLLYVSEIPREYIPYGAAERKRVIEVAWLRELLYEFCHARRRDAAAGWLSICIRCARSGRALVP